MTNEERIYNVGKNTASSINGVETTGKLHAKESNFLIPFTKINSKWIKDKYKTWNHKNSRIKQAVSSLTLVLTTFGGGYVSAGKGSSKNKQVELYQTKSFCIVK